jgi:hypothetical protein
MTLAEPDKAHQGESCGGNVAKVRSCASNLECVVREGAVPDVAGVCNRLVANQ